MRGITRYILNQLFWAMLFVTLALTGVVWLSQSLRFVDLIVNRGLSVFTFVYLTILLLPTFLALILPIALFFAVMYTYHRLTIDSELVILRASGLSQFALARPALILATVMMLVCYGITMFLMPYGFGKFKERQFLIRSDFSQVLLHEGSFNKLVEGLTVYVRARQSNGEVQGILVHDSRIPEAPVTMMAERGALVTSKEGPRFLLINGNRQEMEHGTRKLSLLYFDRYSFDLSDLMTQPGPRWREPRERYMQELLGPPRPGDDPAHHTKLLAEGHQRLASPLYCMVFALIALAAMLGGEFNRRGRVRRMLFGAGAAVTFQGIALALGNVLVKQPAITPLFYAFIAVSAIVAMFLLLFLRLRTRRSGAMAPELAPGVA